MELRTPTQGDPVLRVAVRLAAAATMWHRGDVEGLEHLPRGPALLVGNHGLFGLEAPVFFYLLHRATGRFPVGLADRLLFGRPPVRTLLERIGGVPGTMPNARALLRAGHLVVCYPGGSRETFKPRAARYRLFWESARGFARLSLATGTPVVPFAGLGVDESYLNLGHPRGVRRLFGRYAIPLALGLGPLPFPVKFRFRLSAPIHPPPGAGPDDEHAAAWVKYSVQGAVEHLLRD